MYRIALNIYPVDLLHVLLNKNQGFFNSIISACVNGHFYHYKNKYQQFEQY